MGDLSLGEGDHHDAVVALKRRWGYHVCDDLVDVSLVYRVRGIQLRHGREPDGVIDAWFLKTVGITDDALD